MRVKKINRYYCDFCKKSGGAAGHMKKHEERCTMNPNRFCGVCNNLLQEVQPNLKTILPRFPKSDDVEFLDKVTDIISLDDIREWANECPACILSAIRQAGFLSCDFPSFDYADEMKVIFAEIHEADARADEEEAMYR